MPRRVRLYIATSLDGYIAGPGDALDWLFTDQDYGYDEFIGQVDAIAMGRRTYDIVRGFDEWPYEGKHAWVFTRTDGHEPDPRVTFTSASPAAWLVERFTEGGGDLWLMGGGELARDFLDAHLVDEISVAVHPVILGGGVPLIPPGTHRRTLRLAHSRAWNSGLVMNTYVVQH